MGRADVAITSPNSSMTSGGATNYVVEGPGGALYFIIISSGSRVTYLKSTDGGISWSDQVVVHAAGNATAVAVWYDRWSGIAGDLIHVWSTETTTHTVRYRSIDAASADAMSAEITVFTGVSAVAGVGYLSGARMRGGNLLCAAMIDSGAEGGFFKSTDVGATWTPKTANEALATADQIILLPGWAADNQDAMAFFWDGSADEVSRQLYDDSGDAWAETSIATTMVDTTVGTTAPHFAAAVDLANSQNLLVAWSRVDFNTADLRCWKVTESAITEMTNVVLNSSDDQGVCAIGINTNTQHWHVAYGGKSDGTETWASSVRFYFKASTDGGTTWGAETQLTTTLLATRWAITTPRFARPFGLAYYATLIGVAVTQLRYNVRQALPRALSALGF